MNTLKDVKDRERESGCRVSFVVTSRNDNHGRRMLNRFGIFADALLEQANRHGLAGELIVVEWNPPPGPRLHEVLPLRKKSDSFAIRFIDVPAAAHQAIRNSDTIPLFQMIAKNVGIRRARGQFVVATNPDVLFSDALMSFLATGDLYPDAMYRIDRHDVEADVPEEADIDEQLAWCADHVLRVHGRWGTVVPPRERRWRRAWNACRARAASLRATVQRCARVAPGSARLAWRLLENPQTWRFTPARMKRLFWRFGHVALSMREFLRRRHVVLSMRELVQRGVYNLVPGPFRRAMHRAEAQYGPRRVVRNAVLLGVQKMLGPPRIHTNGCGDFTMLARQHWEMLRGYPELPLWSMHIDSFTCYMAAASGVRERILPPPCRMYHMEHENSWVVLKPEDRLRTFALKPWIDISLLGELWGEAYARHRPLIVNNERWGLAEWALGEVLLLSGEKHVITPGSPLVRVAEER